MRNLRVTIGLALASSLLLLLVSGFVVTSAREMRLVLWGYMAGVVAVYLLERLQALRAR